MLPAAITADLLAAAARALLPITAEMVQAADGNGAVRAVVAVTPPVVREAAAVARFLTVAQAGEGLALPDALT